MEAHSNPLLQSVPVKYTSPVTPGFGKASLNRSKFVMPVVRINQGALVRAVEADSSSGAVSTRPESEGESTSETRSCVARNSSIQRSALCRESMETSKVRLTNLMESLETAGSQMEVLEKQNIDMEQEVAKLKSRLTDEKRASQSKLLKFNRKQFLRASFSAWWMTFKDHRYKSELGRLRREFEEQGSSYESGTADRVVTLEREAEARDKEVAALREELRIEQEKRTRSILRNRTLVDLTESLTAQVKRSCELARELTDEDGDASGCNAVSKKFESDAIDAPVGTYIKDKLHDLLAQVDPRYVPRVVGPSVVERCAQQKVALRTVGDRCAMQMNVKAEGFAYAMNLNGKTETALSTASRDGSISARDPRVEMSPRLWSRPLSFTGFSVARSITSQPPRDRQFMTDFSPSADEYGTPHVKLRPTAE